MDRRELLSSLVLLSVPKSKRDDINLHTIPLNLSVLIRALNNTVRFEMSEAQLTAFDELKVICGIDKDNAFTAGICSMFPITLNPKIPKGEIWIVAFDGTIMSKIINLAIPTGY